MKLPSAQPCPRSIGKKELVKHLEGARLTMRQRLLAKCFECMGGYKDGMVDCQITDCPIYPVMPYRGKTDQKPPFTSPRPLNPPATGNP